MEETSLVLGPQKNVQKLHAIGGLLLPSVQRHDLSFLNVLATFKQRNLQNPTTPPCYPMLIAWNFLHRPQLVLLSFLIVISPSGIINGRKHQISFSKFSGLGLS